MYGQGQGCVGKVKVVHALFTARLSQATPLTSRSLKKDKAMTIPAPCFSTDKTFPTVIQMSTFPTGCAQHTHGSHHLPVSIGVRHPLCTEAQRTE